jgi:GTPase Era involved in 16S rRNA processing
MNLMNEIQTIRESGDAKSVVKILREQKKELEKKLFIVQILQMANHAHKLYEERVFEDNKLHLFEISWYVEDGVGNAFNYQFKSKSDEIIYMTVSNGRKLTPLVDPLLALMNFNEDFISDEFKNDNKCVLEVDENIREKILNILLSKELKKQLEYNELQLDISHKSTKDRKSKI